MAFPVLGKNLGSGIDQMKSIIVGWIRDEIRASQQGGNGLHVDGATGDLVADRGQFRSLNYAPGSAGWGMQPSGNAEFNDLTLRGGIIGNDALTSPVVPGIVNVRTTGFAVTTTLSDVAATTITVPPGCTQLLATCTATAYATNPNATGGNNGAGGDMLSCWVSLNGSTPQGYSWYVAGSGGQTSSSVSGSFQLPNLTPGSTLPISARAHSAFQSLGSNAVNTATINATLVWLR